MLRKRKLIRHNMVYLVAVLAVLAGVEALDNGLARTPPMGWLDWERFRCNTDCTRDPENCISEKLFMAMADRIVADGYRDVGYEYVNIDDCWMAKDRDAKGRLVADPERFPNGILGLAKYVHSKGLKLGIYEDFGTKTCGGFPGSEFYLQLDAQTFADWQVDLLKFDGCYSDPEDMQYGYPIMGKFLNLTGRPILYSCSWPAYIVGQGDLKRPANLSNFVDNFGAIPPYKKIAETCNTWRNYGDIQDSWDSVINIVQFYGKNEGNFSGVSGPGNFNDPDMLIVGDFGLSLEQQKAQMAMWCIMASPLFMSNDLRRMPAESKAILQNIHAIRINQDPMGIQGKQIFDIGNVLVWTRPIMPKGTTAFVVLNKGTSIPTKLDLSVDLLGQNPSGYNITEVFDQTPLGVFKPTEKITISVNPTGVVFAVGTPV